MDGGKARGIGATVHIPRALDQNPLRRRATAATARKAAAKRPVRHASSRPATGMRVERDIVDREQIHRDGYAVLRGAIPAEWLDALRAAFDAGVRPSHEWPVPRGADWRHAMLDLDPQVRAVCRLPPLLAVVGTLIGERFFLSQVEGREPVAGGGHQGLHRDLSDQRPGDTVSALAFFDDYGAWNGATRLIPGSHRPAPDARSIEDGDESRAVVLSGTAGDILVFDADLVHAASLNATGARRRSILIGYFAAPRHASHLRTAGLRGIRMQTTEWFDPPA